MTSNKYRSIFVQFDHMFPDLARSVTHYQAIDRNTIKMQTTAHIDLIFSFIDAKQWSLKTAYKTRDENTSSNEVK